MKENTVPFHTEDIGTRINEISTIVGGKKKLSKLIGISEAQLHRIVSGESQPRLEPIIAMAKEANVSLAWLATGEGPMRLTGINQVNETAATYNVNKLNQEDYAYVTLYDAECSAGGGSWNEDCRPLTQLAFTKYSLNKKGLDARTLSAIRVSGDSMEGDLSDGDAVMIDHAKTDVKGEGIYVIRLDGHLYAKRLQRTFDGIEIISTNKAYKSMLVPKERLNELDVIGQVVWSASWSI